MNPKIKGDTIMKKFLSATLAIVMILLACPLSIFAEGNVIDLQTVNAEGETVVSGSYATFAEAFAALDTLYDGVTGAATTEALYEAAGKPVLKLTADITAAASSIPWNNTTDIDGAAVRTVVIDGTNPDATTREENYTISFSGDGYVFTNLAICDFTVKNTNFAFTATAGDGKIAWGGSGIVEQIEVDATFENCIINNAYTGDVNHGGLFKLNGKAKNGILGVHTDPNENDIFNLTLKDCSILEQSAQSLQVHWGADANISLVNTTWVHESSATSVGNHSIIKAYESGDINISLDGTSVLESRVSTSAYSSLIHALQTVGGGAKFELHLAEGATLYVNDQSDITSYFILNNNASFKVYDEGANWKVGTAVAGYGVTLPTWMGETGMIGWKSGDTALGATYTATITEPATLTHYEIDPTTVNYAVYVTNGDGTIHKGYYSTIESTYSMVTNGDVIHLMKDLTLVSAQKPTYTYGQVTIDGTKATDAEGNVTERYSATTTGDIFTAGNIDLTLSNIIVSGNRGLILEYSNSASKPTETFTTTLDNVKLTATGGIAFKIGGGSRDGNYILNISDSEIISNAKDTVFFGAGDGLQFDINLHRTKGTGGGNGYIFNLYNVYGGTVDLTGTTEMNVRNDATNWAGVFYVHNTSSTVTTVNPVKVTLGAGVKMNLLSTTTTSADTEFFYCNNGALSVTDHGAIYTVSPQVAKLGVNLPAFTGMPYTFDNGETTTVSGNRYYGDTMIPVSSYIADLSGTGTAATDADGNVTTFYIPDATENVTFTNKAVAPTYYDDGNDETANDADIALLRKDAEGNVVKTYTESQIATAWSETAEGETLVFLRDIFTQSQYMNPGSKSYTVDGQGKYGIIQSNSIGNYISYAPIGTLTLKDMTLNVQGGFWWEKSGEQKIVLDGVSMVNGSARNFIRSKSGAATGSNDVVMINGTKVTLYTSPANNEANVNLLIDNSTLELAVSPTWQTTLTVSMVNGGALAYTARVLNAAGETGVALPSPVDSMGTATPWIIDGALSTATTFADADATETVKIYALTSLFDTLTGASIRTEDPNGIRFSGWFDDELLAIEGVEVGLLVTLNTDTLTADTFTLALTEDANVKVINQVGGQYYEDGTDNFLRVALCGIKEGSYDVEFAARAYVKVGDVVYYAEFDADNVRSMKEVAVLAAADYPDSELIQAIANS